MSSTQRFSNSLGSRFKLSESTNSRKIVIAVILGVALLAFEIFNFDTTQYALRDLLGDVNFMGIMWATILAIAFCSIDFAGLVRIVTPEKGREEPRMVWFLMGAWFLGTLANAILTWWAVSLTLLDHQFGNEVLSREQLLRYVPIFVAALVWLTRILFIGAFSVAGDDVFDSRQGGQETRKRPQAKTNTAQKKTSRSAARPASAQSAATQPRVTYEPLDEPVMATPVQAPTGSKTGQNQPRKRPPMPANSRLRRPTPQSAQARPKNYS